MNITATLILAFAMSMDAFAAAISKGAALHRPPLREALRTGLIFGAIEAVTPLIGWSCGIMASQYVIEWDHWIAFTLLFVLGVHMIIEGCKSQSIGDQEKPNSHSFLVLATTAVATSLDALAIGVGLAFIQVNIVHTALAIGIATTLMATLGMLIGRYIGPLLGKRAEIAGGVVLIGIGFHILAQHLGFLS